MSLIAHRTYFVSESITGPSGGGPSGTNKDMLTLFNPLGSGKLLKLRELIVQCSSSSGTNVIVEYELRRITGHTENGTPEDNLTPHKRELSDAASVAESYKEPNAVAGATRIWTHVLQSNTQQSPASHLWLFGPRGMKPLVLAPGEGVVFHQVTSNGGTFVITAVWTEE